MSQPTMEHEKMRKRRFSKELVKRNKLSELLKTGEYAGWYWVIAMIERLEKKVDATKTQD